MNIDVAIMMGSKSDLETMRPAAKVLQGLGLQVAVRVLSAHRTPAETATFVKDAAADQYRFKSLVLGVISTDAFRKRDADPDHPVVNTASIRTGGL